LIPDATKTYDLGSTSNYFRDAFLRKLLLSSVVNEGLASHLYPVSKGLYDLGSATRYMRTVNFNRIRALDLTLDTHYWYLSSGASPDHLQDIFAFDWCDGVNTYTMLELDPTLWVIQTYAHIIPTFDDGVNLGDETTPLRFANLFLSQFIKLGGVASLPTADASYRGKMIRLEPGAGAKDILYLCKKKADDTYAWLKLLDELDGGGGGPIPSDTVVSETSFGQSPSAGSATTYSRGDHTHGTPTHEQVPREKGVISVNPPSIAKASTVNVDVAVVNLLTTDKIHVQCQSDLEHGLVCIAAYCPTNGWLRLRITNWSSAAVDGAARNWAYWAWA